MSTISTPGSTSKPWPSEHLEAVPHCPVCGSASGRTLWHEDMTDRVFRIAPGVWSLYRCNDCGSGWLDPRPDAASLPDAYSGYFTHDAIRQRVIVRRTDYARRWLHDVLNGYMNHRYGTRHENALAYGRWLAWLAPPLRAAADATCRHLPPVPKGGGRLLDVGCGNGAFLRLAQGMGWTVAGVDFDPDAARQARAAGFEVTVGGVESLSEVDCYDVITISHVIEHVPDPCASLRAMWRLLKPNGTLWLETPSLRSLGHRMYGSDWRGLEPPRHLVLFDGPSLQSALRNSGFLDISQHWNALVSFEVLRSSAAIRRGGDALATGASIRRLPLELLMEGIEMLIPAHREFLTFTARKPATT